MRFERTGRFKRMYKKIDSRDQEQIKKALKLMSENIWHPSLRTKRVQGTKNVWEASASMNLRITFVWEEEVVILRNCGEHDNTLKNP